MAGWHAPGFTRTAMYERVTGSDAVRDAVNSVLPLHRAGTPEEIAEAVLYASSDKASYLTGQTIGDMPEFIALLDRERLASAIRR